MYKEILLAGHFRAIGDQVNMAPKGPLLRRTHKLQGSHEDSSLKKLFEV